tara:strand:+ start:7460 stop:8083 length:624 start_codon:yes stop_codon:yes gene_type:complete
MDHFGGRGVYGHTGFMAALEKLDIPISSCAGSSAGAIVGGVMASGTNIQDWIKTITQVNTKQFWTPQSMLQLLYRFGLLQGRGVTGLSSTAAAIRFLTGQLAVQTFEDCIYPLSTVVVNLGECEKTVFDKGLLAPRIMASAAMPGLYEPVEIEGQYYTDGAVIDLAPADAICCRYQLDMLLVHHLAQRDYTTGERECSEFCVTVIPR